MIAKIKRVGIYIGAFDPIHAGHLAFAQRALEEAHLDKIFFVPEPRPRHKQGVKALEHRTEMVRLAITDEIRFGLLSFDASRPSLLETWPRIQARFADAELCLLMGEDVFARLSHWPRVDNLITDVRFVVGCRPSRQDELNDHLKIIAETRGLGFTYEVFSLPEEHVSSLVARRALRRGERPEGLADAVWSYIQSQGLYS